MLLKSKVIILFLIIFSSSAAAYQGSFTPSLSDWGGVGLMQTPTARFYQDGDVSFGPTRAFPHTLVNLNFQFLPWLQPTLRYIITDDVGGACEKNYDRSLDVKFLLLSESDYLPQIAIGFQDALGTPYYRSEFVVFSKRFYDFDFTLGLGWGKLGSRAHFKNVLGCLNTHFKKRGHLARHKGGIPGVKDFFRGTHMALFGGVEFSTPVQGLNLKVEYNSNTMADERLHQKYRDKTAVNFGASYQLTNWVQLRAGLEQGHQLMVGASLMGNFHETPPHPQLPVPPVRKRGQPMPGAPALKPGEKPAPPPPLHVVAEALYKKAGMPLVALYQNAPMLTIYCENNQYRLPAVAMARIARILTFIAPDNIDFFKIVLVEKGMNVTSMTVLRRDIENLGSFKGSAEEVTKHAWLEAVSPCYPSGTYVNPKLHPHYTPYIVPRFKQTLFDAGRGMRFQVILAGGVKAEFAPGLLGSAEIGVNVYNQLDNLNEVRPSKLSRVRSDIKRYASDGRVHLAHFQIDKIAQLNANLFGRLSTGFFESMYAGYSGELLYRVYDSPCAFGVEVNHVHQRDFNQLLGFRGYEVTTGHFSFYTDLPFWDLHTNIHLGRYLAKDWGGTIEVSRRFDTGIEVGFYTTHTNVAHDVYGEGSFDKGVWFKIPLDFILGGHHKKGFDYMLRPLSKDGGQRVHVNNRLYNMIRDHSGAELRRQFGHIAE